MPFPTRTGKIHYKKAAPIRSRCNWIAGYDARDTLLLAVQLALSPPCGLSLRCRYVLGSVAATALVTQYLAVKVAFARRECSVPYPAMYAEGSSEAAVRFNCVQRSHQNMLEYLPNVLALQMLMGLRFPITAAAMGGVWAVARLIYAAGYSTGEPAKRLPGNAIAGIVYLALIVGCGYAGYSMLF